MLALVTCIVIGLAFAVQGSRFLTPGPLSSSHSSIETCSSCHTKSGGGALSWIAGLAPRDRLLDSKACMTCHEVPYPAFNAHGASSDVLAQSTRRLLEVAEDTLMPLSARTQSIALPTDPVVAHGLPCATCHQEHKGANARLDQISNEQCRSCHVVKFDDFDGGHPEFAGYPFERRTRIIYDHAGHFAKHFPETAKKEPSKTIPTTCDTCHTSHADKRVMGVASFEKTCATCHLDQITGKQRVSGPKGIAFLTVPGLDLQSLKKKKVIIGEWPAESEARLTPFMKMMIGRNEQGRAVVKAVETLNLQDLSGASDDQMKAVADLAWETKALFYQLATGKASVVLDGLDVSGLANSGGARIANLAAGIPRDVIIAAQQHWLPNLAREIAGRQGPTEPKPSGWTTTTLGSGRNEPTDEPVRSGSTARQVGSEDAPQVVDRDEARTDVSSKKPGTADANAGGERTAEQTTGRKPPGPAANSNQAAANSSPNPQDCLLRVFGECIVSKQSNDATDTSAPTGRSRLTPPMRAGLQSIDQAAAGPIGSNGTSPRESVVPATRLAQAQSAGQNDDLLFPTEEELRAIKPGKNADRLGRPLRGQEKASTGGATSDVTGSSAAAPTAPADRPVRATASEGIESSLDPESWAEHGGWYRQDYAISYRPAGHKDTWLYSWLMLTGPKAQKGAGGPAAAVFDTLTRSDAQGACAKCHSVDESPGNGRFINFSPMSAAHKKGRFTTFVHEPHFGIMPNGGCLTCHKLEKVGTYLKSYENSTPLQFASNFGQIKKDLCKTCHTSSQARQDCLLCHTYHVNGVVTPIMKTKISSE